MEQKSKGKAKDKEANAAAAAPSQPPQPPQNPGLPPGEANAAFDEGHSYPGTTLVGRSPTRTYWDRERGEYGRALGRLGSAELPGAR
ncbi:hypothetical protein FS837_001717 [Tulasnella sp. UAMH 9824]|nr:hypothetical protein FS837_001717 [Tulasnella sp. UAMH 9824]